MIGSIHTYLKSVWFWCIPDIDKRTHLQIIKIAGVSKTVTIYSCLNMEWNLEVCRWFLFLFIYHWFAGYFCIRRIFPAFLGSFSISKCIKAYVMITLLRVNPMASKPVCVLSSYCVGCQGIRSGYLSIFVYTFSCKFESELVWCMCMGLIRLGIGPKCV